MPKTLYCIFLTGAILSLAGCSTVQNAHGQKSGMMDAYLAGNVAKARKKAAGKLSSAKGTGDELMWTLECASLAFSAGDFRKCLDYSRSAEQQIEAYDERAKVSLRDVSAEGGAAFVNSNVISYKGFSRDRIWLSCLKALAYAGTGDESAFRAQIRRMRDEQKRVLEVYDLEKKTAEKELEDMNKKNPEEAQKAKDNDPLSSDRNEDYKKSIAEMRRHAAFGFADFQNPAAIYLSALSLYRDGEYENARIEFDKLHALLPQNRFLAKWNASVLRKCGKKLPSSLKNTTPFPFPAEEKSVYVFYASGRSAALRQTAIYFPIMTAWPACEFYPELPEKLFLTADGKEFIPEKICSMDSVFAKEFEERLPGITARIIISTLIKESAYYGGLAVIASSDMHPAAKALTFASVAAGGAAYRAAVNTADTRTWEVLPQTVSCSVFPMPEDRTVILSDSGNTPERIRIPQNVPSCILYLEKPSSGVKVRSFILPLKSK